MKKGEECAFKHDFENIVLFKSRYYELITAYECK